MKLKVVKILLCITLLSGLFYPPSNVSAAGVIGVMATISPNPLAAKQVGTIMLYVDNIGDGPMQLEVQYTPPSNPGFKLKGVSVIRKNDHARLCRKFPCTVTALAPGDGILITVDFMARNPGEYIHVWNIIHDGWETPYGFGVTVYPDPGK